MMSKQDFIAGISKSKLPALHKSFAMLIIGQIPETDIQNAIANAPKVFQQIQQANKSQIFELLKQANLPTVIADILLPNGHKSE